MVKNQAWLEYMGYKTKEKIEKATELLMPDRWGTTVPNELELSDFVNLEKLCVSKKELTSLDVSKCQQLKELDCSHNQLTNFDFSTLNPNKLIKLDISSNNFSNSDLSSFASFTNLEVLKIGNNRFHGNLESLKNLTKLRELDIDNTDINSGWEYLPASIEKISYSSGLRPESKVKEIAKQLQWISKDFSAQQLKGWIDIGFQPDDYGFASYLSKQGYQPQTNQNYEELKSEYYSKSQKSQSWLDKYSIPWSYSKWGRTEQISLNEPSLEGELDFARFNNLAGLESLTVYISPQVDETKLVFKNLPQKFEIILLDAQKWLEIQEKYNTKEKREKIEELKIEGGKLEGHLDLKDFTSLKKLDCSSNNLTSLDISNCSQLKWINSSHNKLTFLDLSNCPQLEWINYSHNNLTSLELSKLSQLEGLESSDNQLIGLDLSDCVNLIKVNCGGNRITNLNLSGLTKLKELSCQNNQLTGLDFLLNLPPNNQLTELRVNGNPLTGGLTSLQNCSNLKVIDFGSTNLEAELQYLPFSLEKIDCEGKIREELELYGNNLIAWWEAHPELMEQVGKKITTSDYTSGSLPLEKILVTTIPEHLKEVIEQSRSHVIDLTTKTNYNRGDKEFILRDLRPFSWKKEFSTTSSEPLLPLRLYNLKTGRVEETKGRTDIPNYLALSYCWGTEWEDNKEMTVTKADGKTYDVKLTKLGRKALNKVINTFNLLNKEAKTDINYIWIDNFCINQQDPAEKGQEVANQRNYYNNASATLIAIDAEIGERRESKCELYKHIIKQIATSPWFTRSWTFQEGLLSKQTIFMLDDGLADGRMLANLWSFLQGFGLKEEHELGKKSNFLFVTPLGWSHGASPEQKVSLRLSQALQAVKHRSQTVPVDGIYSILGLLPYGEQVKTRYKSKECSCSEEERKNCQHWPTYTREYLNEALLEVAKVAKDVDLLGLIFWYGTRRSELKWWWIPEMNERGYSEAEWFEQEDYNEVENDKLDFEVTERGIKLGCEDAWNDYNELDYYYEDRVEVPFGKTVINVPRKDKTQPITFQRVSSYAGEYDWCSLFHFIDMVDKEIILGEKAIQEYQEIKKAFPNQQFTPSPREKYYSHPREYFGRYPTFQDSTIFQSQDKFYIWKENQLREIIKIKSASSWWEEDEWEYKNQELQAQVEIPTQK